MVYFYSKSNDNNDQNRGNEIVSHLNNNIENEIKGDVPNIDIIKPNVTIQLFVFLFIYHF